MNQLSNIKQAYFLGIGGIGMSAICRYLIQQGVVIAGYDKTETSLTKELSQAGAQITYVDAINTLPNWLIASPEESIVIITPAIPKDHQQKNWLESHGYTLYKRSEILGILTNNSHCLAVAGTHGKTTTSTLLAHILKELNWNFSSFLGGISTNYNSNYIYNDKGSYVLSDPITVVEADEFDRSFHRLTPSAAIITAVDADHLDIYENKEAFTKAFTDFTTLIRKEQTNPLIVHYSLKALFPTALTYGIETSADFQIQDIRIYQHQYFFDIHYQGEFATFKAGLPGYHNVLNATAAVALCHAHLGIPLTSLTTAIESFKGVKRRFEYLVNQPNQWIIDDYAHHPAELSMTIQSVKTLYPKIPLTGIFQPHLFSRTRDFAKEFAAVLDTIDQPILLEIYPAREQPIEGISSQFLAELMQNKHVKVMSKQEVLQYLEHQKPALLLLLGAGDIDQLREPIKSIYE